MVLKRPMGVFKGVVGHSVGVKKGGFKRGVCMSGVVGCEGRATYL